MAFKTTVKTDKAFKNLLGYAYSEEEKNYWEEGIYWALPLDATNLWLESGSIVHNDPAATVSAGIAVKYDQFVMTANSSAFYNGKDRAWNIRVTPGDEGSALITGFIPHVRYGDNFMFRLYDNDDNLITVPQMISEGIIFDYANGVVVLNDDSAYTFNVPFKITVWKYSGQTGEDVGAGGAEQRVYYDSWVQYNETYPTTDWLQRSPNERYAYYLANNFSLFGERCKWEFHNFDTGETVDNLTMSGTWDIVSYQNANVPNNGSAFTQTSVYKPYDIIDENIPVIDKMYGMNRLYGALKGKHAYKNGAPHCGNVSGAFIKAGEIMWAMFDAQFPNYSGFITANDFLNGNGKYGMWLPSAEKKMYGIPRNNSAVYFDGSLGWFRGRYNFCENWEGPTTMVNPDVVQIYYLTDAKICSWNGFFNNTGSTWVTDLYTTGQAGISHIPEIDITPSRDATANTLDNNLGTHDIIRHISSFEWRWDSGTKKINKVSVTLSVSAGMLSSADLEFYIIPPNETNPNNYYKFFTYNYTGGALTDDIITATMPRNYEWCDGIYIIPANIVGEEEVWLQEFDAYEYNEAKTILPNNNRQSAVASALSPYSTSVICFKAINPVGGPGERDFAVYIKPLGIDTVWINNIDFNKYDLEAVLLNRDRQKTRFRVIPQSDTIRAHSRGDEVGIKKQYWLQTDAPYDYYAGGWKRMPEAYLRLRDKTTKKVGRLSRSKIKPLYDQGSVPLKFMVV